VQDKSRRRTGERDTLPKESGNAFAVKYFAADGQVPDGSPFQHKSITSSYLIKGAGSAFGA
jgi:hypothetical protein